jgi:transcriptional regulator with XRE-family HTH domain
MANHSSKPSQSLGEKVRNLRIEKGYSQQALAKAIGRSQATISSVENDNLTEAVAKIVLKRLEMIPAKAAPPLVTGPMTNYLKGLLTARQLMVSQLAQLDNLIKDAQE